VEESQAESAKILTCKKNRTALKVARRATAVLAQSQGWIPPAKRRSGLKSDGGNPSDQAGQSA
jgi:hypothetical protein